MYDTTQGNTIYINYKCSFCEQYSKHMTKYVNNFTKPFIYSMRCNHCQNPNIFKAQFLEGKIELLYPMKLQDVYFEKKPEIGLTVKPRNKRTVRTSKG